MPKTQLVWTATAIVFTIATTIGAATAFRQPRDIGQPPGRLINVDGRRLHIHCVGQGTPTVVIDGGAGTWSIFYSHVQRALEADARVCTYDRAGLGWSDDGPAPRTSDRMAEELHQLLHAAGVAPPLLLVGHSLGGYNVRVYQARYPEEVGGLVLVDAAHEQQWERLPPEWADGVKALVPMLRARAEMVKTGKVPESEIKAGAFTTHAPEWRQAHIAAQLTPKPYLGTAAENDGAFESARQVPRAKLGSLPLVVLTARRSFETFAGAGLDIEPANSVWLELQRELAALSSNSIQLFSARDHALHGSDPTAIVAAIRKGIAMVRDAGPRSRVLGRGREALSPTSTEAVDRLLVKLEAAYESMDAGRFVELFTDDVIQLDVPRRVHVKGRHRWLTWTRDQINAAHRRMSRRHHGRAVAGPWVIAEVEWSGIVKGEALGNAGGDREYRYTGLVLMRLEGDRIAEQIIYGDQPTLLEQLRDGQS
jgi:pimeloyl-ACP methyl ester carboxylesterase/ketosteroid isomerase-like protein